MKHPTRASRLRGLSGVLAAALVLSACGAGGRDDDDGDGNGNGNGGGASDVGVTEDTITIGAHFPLTGVAAPGYSEIPTGAKAYFDFVNANGGVHGREIEYIVKDDGYNPSNTSKVTNELVMQDEIFAMVGGLGTPTHSAVVDFLNDEGVPDLFVSSGSLQWGDDPGTHPMTFGWQPDYESEAKIVAQYVSENMPNAKVGLFLQDDDLGEDAEKGVRRFLDDDQIVAVERYTSGNTDVGPQIAGLQGAGADLVLAFNTPSYTALARLVSLQLGYEPRWFVSNIGADPDLVSSLLAQFSEGAVEGRGALDGTMTTEYIPGLDQPEDPWTQLWEKVWDEHGERGKLTNYRIYGMSHAYTFVQALQAAGEDLTREGIVEVLESEGGDWAGPNLAPYRYSGDSHMGISGMRIVELEGSSTKELTPVLVTDIGDAEITEDDSGQAEDAPPESGLPE